MTFDPLKFYEDEQRKQKRYNSLLPVFLVAVVLLVAFYGFFVAYQRSHAKVKPVAVSIPHMTAGGCIQFAGGNLVASPCSEVKAVWIRCNEGMEVTDYRDCPEFKTAYAEAYTVLARKLYPQRTRKHKRKTDIYSLCRTNHGTVSQCRAEADYLAGKTATTFTSGTVPVSNGANISNWDTYSGGFTQAEPLPKAKYVFEDCDPVSSAQIGRYSDIIVTCSGHEVQLIWRDGPHETTPADITNLMERIAPTAHADIKLKPAPDCKMPADIDVCPIQMIDEKGKP